MSEDGVVKFKVYGVPKAKREARVQRRKNKYGGWYDHHYQPTEVEMWEDQVRLKASEMAPPEFWAKGPVSIIIILLRPLPDSKERKTLPPIVWKDTRPDGDRLACAIFDGVQEIIYKNDSQVALHLLAKLYTSGRPSVTVVLRRLNPRAQTDLVRMLYELAGEPLDGVHNEPDCDQPDLFAEMLAEVGGI